MAQTTASAKNYSSATWFLIYAVKRNKPSLVQNAILWGGNVNVILRNDDTLLHICPTAEIASILLAHGANIAAVNAAGQTPLHTAMRRDLPDLALFLINSNANVNAQEPNGTAPLHLAESSAVNAALLQHNAFVDIQNNAGDTPLHLAIRSKGSPIVIALVNAGADKNIRNNLGNNAYNELVLLTQIRETELAKVSAAILSPAQQSQATFSESFTALRTRFVNAQNAYYAGNVEYPAAAKENLPSTDHATSNNTANNLDLEPATIANKRIRIR